MLFLNLLLMCTAIRFSRFEFSRSQLEQAGYSYCGENGEQEVRVSFLDRNSFLPVHYNGHNLILPWGNKTASKAPRTGFCKIESLEAGKWQWLNPEKVLILACFALSNGVWFHVRQGIEGVILTDDRRIRRCYMLTKPSTHYFRIMTGSERMPVLFNQIL